MEFGRVRRADPRPGAGVEASSIVVLWRRHVRAVGIQHVWVGVGRLSVQVPGRRGQIQETAADPRPACRAQTFGLQGLLKLGAISALSGGRRVSVSGAGEGGGVEGGRGV